MEFGFASCLCLSVRLKSHTSALLKGTKRKGDMVTGKAIDSCG